jgi:hypothetical protein
MTMYSGPSLDGYTNFIRNVMLVSTDALPADSELIGCTYDMAYSQVNDMLANIPGMVYALAIYNLAADYLISWAPDQTGQTFFKDARKSYGVNNFAAGVVAGSADSGTSTSLLVSQAMQGLTIGQLSNLKTPYGRTYLALAQSWGTCWGIT